MKAETLSELARQFKEKEESSDAASKQQGITMESAGGYAERARAFKEAHEMTMLLIQSQEAAPSKPLDINEPVQVVEPSVADTLPLDEVKLVLSQESDLSAEQVAVRTGLPFSEIQEALVHLSAEGDLATPDGVVWSIA